MRFSAHLTRAGVKPIWPISSNRAPRQRGPRATHTKQRKLTLSIDAACVWCRRGAQCFLKCFERPNRFSIFFQRSLTIQYKLALLPHQNTPKPCFTVISLFRWNNCGHSKSLCSEQSQNLKKIWSGPQYFVSVASAPNENPSELRRFLTPSSKFYSKYVHCFQWCGAKFFSLAPR